jgi:hypothetical protein
MIAAVCTAVTVGSVSLHSEFLLNCNSSCCTCMILVSNCESEQGMRGACGACGHQTLLLAVKGPLANCMHSYIRLLTTYYPIKLVFVNCMLWRAVHELCDTCTTARVT